MSDSEVVRLTGRDALILRCLINGDTDKIIAWKTGIGLHSLCAHHLVQLYRKIGVNNRTQAAIWAWKRGLSALPGGKQ